MAHMELWDSGLGFQPNPDSRGWGLGLRVPYQGLGSRVYVVYFKFPNMREIISCVRVFSR